MSPSATSDIFRRRLQELIDRVGRNQAAFARLTGVDRSTLSQLVSSDGARLPRADTLVAVASACRVSVDWLLGLSDQQAVAAEIIEAAMQVEPHTRTPMDERFAGWLREAEGYRIRTVPESFPDFLKTEGVIRFEYQGALSGTGGTSFEAVNARLALMRRSDGDLEVCVSIEEITGLALGQARWRGLSRERRQEQLAHFIELYEELYPNLRIYLYSRRDTYANPFTVFGPKRVALFLGTNFLVLNSLDHIRLFSRRFDDLIRRAVAQPHEFVPVVRDLIEEAG